MKFVHYRDLFGSVQTLAQRGGKFSRAAAQVAGVLKMAQRKNNPSDVFIGIPTTKNGESRIQHCTKYDLQASCRLITVQHNNICFLMYAGTHDDCDEWLTTNKGIRFHLKNIDGRDVIESTRASDDIFNPQMRLQTIPDFSLGLLWEKLPTRYFEILMRDLSTEILLRVKSFTAATSDEELLDVALQTDPEKINVIYDCFDLLRGGQVQEAKARVDLFLGNVKAITVVTEKDIENLSSGDEVILNDDIDPILFEHFIKTASFQKWMAYLHPGQREFVNRDFNGAARLTGVSGSGKTSVLIHRAVRLAKKYPLEKILVLTLNRALATMIKDLTKTVTGEEHLNNLAVMSFWELCRDELVKFEPKNKLIYSDKTVKTNRFAISEHIDEIWEEYFQCRNNNSKASVLNLLQRTLIGRGIYPSDYIRQEFDYVRSALGPNERDRYLKLEREGRSIPLEERYRKNVTEGLEAWEEKMTGVGAIDYLGLATALYRHLEKIPQKYRCILIDEMQDFGSIELRIVRALAPPQQNDIFLCGDLAQSVLTKYHKLSESGIDVSGRSHSIRRNYRNSREILTSAFSLFEKNKDLLQYAKGVEILNPEFANFSSSPPLLLKSDRLAHEFGYAINYSRQQLSESGGDSKKICIAVCSKSQSEIEEIGRKLNLEVLTGDTDVVAGQIFISDLEQTKGFEFDSMIILNCSEEYVPHPALPKEECYRELCKIYVAMTRAKTELIVSYSNSWSKFLDNSKEYFTLANWDDHAELSETPFNLLNDKKSASYLTLSLLSGQEILYLPEAVGLSTVAQEKLLQIVTGINRFKNKKQFEWKEFSKFMEDATSRATLRGHNGISDSVWDELKSIKLKLAASNLSPNSIATVKRATITLPKITK